jgi:hypothetical protein
MLVLAALLVLTEIGYLSHRFQDRVYDWVSTKTNFPARRIMERLMRGPNMAWAASGWITNLDLRARSVVFGATRMTPLSGPDLSVPVPFPARRHQYHITAPPEPEDGELSTFNIERSTFNDCCGQS